MLLVGLLSAGCSSGAAPDAASTDSAPPLPTTAVAESATLVTQVATPGSGEWADSLDLSLYDQIDVLMMLTNTTTTDMSRATLFSTPSSLRFVPDSMRLTDPAHPDGIAVPNGDMVITNGVEIGSYKPGERAYVTYRAQVGGSDIVPCGTSGEGLMTPVALQSDVIWEGGQIPEVSGVILTLSNPCQPREVQSNQPAVPPSDSSEHGH